MGLIQRLKGFISSTAGKGRPVPADLQKLQDQVTTLLERSREQQEEIDELRADSLRIAELRIQVEDHLFTNRS